MITNNKFNVNTRTPELTIQEFNEDNITRLLIGSFSMIGIVIILMGLIDVENQNSGLVLGLIFLSLIILVFITIFNPQQILSNLFIGILSAIGVLLILFGLIATANLKASRTLGFIKNSMALFVVIAATRPKEKELKLSLIIGAFTVFLDYLVESIAFVMGWWYATEGTTYPPFLIVPFEMIIEFLPLGAAYILIWDLPRSKRNTNIQFFRTVFERPYFIYVWTLFILIATGFLGVYGDFYGANGSVFFPHEDLTQFHIFLVWTSCGFAMIGLHKYLVTRLITTY